MTSYYLIACCSKKLPLEPNETATAGELYQSALFKKSLAYAKSRPNSGIFVLSAKYGLLPLDREVCSYEKTLNNMSAADRHSWSSMVLQQMQEQGFDLQNDGFVFLAGQRYRKDLVTEMAKWANPLEGLTIGKQLQWLTVNASAEKEAA